MLARASNGALLWQDDGFPSPTPTPRPLSDIKLFRLTQDHATELQGASSGLEKHLQNLIENNLEALLGIRFLSTEYFTGKTHAGQNTQYA